MKKYISTTNTISNQALVAAIKDLLWVTTDWEDENAATLADMAGLEIDELADDFDESTVINQALTVLVKNKSADLAEFIDYTFTEEYLIETVVDAVATDTDIRSAIDTIFGGIKSFPNGDKVRANIQKNIYNSPVYKASDIAQIGSKVGHTYWKYISAEEYGVRTNQASAVGSTVSDGEYCYTFSQDISSYYFMDKYPEDFYMPAFVEVVFKTKGAGAIAVIDAFISIGYDKKGTGIIDHEIVSSAVESWMVPNVSADTIESVSKDIANWLDVNVDYIVQTGVDAFN